MKYYRMSLHIPDQYGYVSKIEIEEEKKFKIMDGIPIDEAPINYSFIARDLVPDLIGLGSDLLLVSTELKEILEEMSFEHIQFVKTTCLHLDKTFWLINILHNLSAMDRVESEFTTYESNPDAIRKIKKLVINSTIPGNRPIFKLDESKIIIIVNEILKEKLEALQFTGMTFSPIEQV